MVGMNTAVSKNHLVRATHGEVDCFWKEKFLKYIFLSSPSLPDIVKLCYEEFFRLERKDLHATTPATNKE